MPPPQPVLSAKGAHYNSVLRAVLVRGAWDQANPGTTPNGSVLSWSELLRKWNKHTGGSSALVQHLRNVSLLDLNSAHHILAAPTQVGSSASSGDGRSHETGASGSASSYVHISPVSGHVNTAPNGASHSRSASVTASASASNHPTATSAFRSDLPNMDGEDGASGNAWVRGANWGQSLDVPHAEEVRQGARELETLLNGASLTEPERVSATLTLAYHHHALAEHDAALVIYEQFDWTISPTIGAVDGDAAVVERIRARTFQGISFELCSQPDLSRAMLCYLDAAALLNSLSVSPITTPSYLLTANAARTVGPGVEVQRELLRHISTALTRAAVIAARGSDAELTLRVLRTYHAMSSMWADPTFRVNQRQRMLRLYLAALQSSYPASGSVASEPYLLSAVSPMGSARALWRAEVVETMRNGQRMLSDTTAFPRAGEFNDAVTEFTDQIAAFPDLSSTLASETIDILWWGTTLTFQSQSIMRHLVRLLSSSGDQTEARRTFELYVELVLKARQTHDPDSPLKLERRPTETAEDPASEKADIVPEDGDRDLTLEGGMESDEEFTATLLVGAELLLSSFDDSEEAWRYVTLAGEVVKYSRSVSPKLAAKVEECGGVVRLAMSTSVAGPSKRPLYQTQAINHLTASTTIDPSSSDAFYHLAYAYTTARDIDAAIDTVRSALELNSESVRAWHLLALLFTAQGDWQGASKAGETGVALWEANDEAITADEADTAGNVNEQLGCQPLLLASGDIAAPVAAPPQHASRSSRLETVIQLRMTLNVIAEKLHGPEFALERHQQLFSFFSQRTDRRASRTVPPSEFGSSFTNAPANLGDSYVLTQPADAQASPTTAAAVPAINIIGNPSPTGAITPSSVDDSSSPSDGDERRVTIARSASGRRKLLPKHLHVPSVVRHHMRTASGAQQQLGRREPSSRSVSLPASMSQSRAVSQSTLAPSIAPTAVHSHYRGARGAIPAPPPLVRPASRRTPAEERILSDLWLMSAASFRRAGKHGQALVAIEEAETHDPENPNVWVQLGLLQLAEYGSAGGPDAIKALTKALLLRPDYPPAVVHMARLNLTQGDVDLAHSLLWQLTEDKGWDVPEAWLALAKACEQQGRAPRARECLLEALRLERSRLARPLGDALRQW